MPIYEFACENCGREFELLLASSNWSGASCPHCRSSRLQKKLSVFATGNAGGEASACESASCPMTSGRRGSTAACGCCAGWPATR